MSFIESVPPRPLPAPSTGDDEVDALARALAEGGPGSVDAATTLERDATRHGAAVAALLRDEVLDLGVLAYEDTVRRRLPRKERRAYGAAHEAAAKASYERATWLRTVALAAARS